MKRLLLAVFISFVFPFAHGQEIQRPALVVGDWCEYAADGVGVSMQRREVVEVSADGGHTSKFSDDAGVQLRVYNMNGQMIRSGGREYSYESSGGGIFPLSEKVIGRVSRHSRPHSSRPGVIVEVKSEVRSVASEKITVPAGIFDTLRVEIVSDYRYREGNYANQFIDTVWYALDPKMKFPVRLAFVDHGIRSSMVTRSLTKCGSAQPGK